MPRKTIPPGTRFGKLVVIEPGGIKNKQSTSVCICDCGVKKEICNWDLKRGVGTASCGCGQHRKTHGKTGSKTFRSWYSMIQRCTNPRNKSWAYYGGRGIKVCARWESFENFYADMGDPPPGMTLDRKENHKGYEPGNCRWATRVEQMRNKRNNRIVMFRGENMALSMAAEIAGIQYNTVISRINTYGWSVSRALTAPTRLVRRKQPRQSIMLGGVILSESTGTRTSLSEVGLDTSPES